MATEKENQSKSNSSHSSEMNNESRKKRRGLLSRIWNGLFFFSRTRGDDFEKRLQHLSKEEAAVLARIKRRSHTWRRMARHLIIFSVFFEIFAVVYAVLTTRSLDLNWKMRAFRVLPMFLLPLFSFASYSGLLSFNRMCDRKDQKTLERLRAERQAKINELKERTNYYTTQQLIQQYDPDPAAKAAAATVLASKLGADSGLKVYVGDESQFDPSSGKSNDVELVHTSGLRNRKDSHARSGSEKGTAMHQPQGDAQSVRSGVPRSLEHEPLVVDHYDPNGSSVQDGGWIARIAALLVGEDPRQSYALICGNCHMHNGLARKEDYPYITYYCPHCSALNRPKQTEETVSGSTSPGMSSLSTGGGTDVVNEAAASGGPTHVTTGIASDLMEKEKSITEEVVAESSN